MAHALLILAICIFSAVQGSILEVTQCPLSGFWHKQNTINLENTKLQITTDLDAIKFYADPQSSVVHFKGDEVTVEITDVSNGKSTIFSQSVRKINGIARRKIFGETTYKISDSHIIFSMNHDEITGSLKNISHDIESEFQRCIEEAINNRFSKLEGSEIRERSSMSADQSFANRAVDVALNQILEGMGMSAPNNTIPIPDFTFEFKDKVAGKRISGFGGRIGDMTGFKRISDVNLTSNVTTEKYEASCSFGIEKMHVYVDDFTMDIFGRVTAPLEVEITNLRMDVKATLYETHYFTLPFLDEIKLAMKLEKIKISNHPEALTNRLKIKLKEKEDIEAAIVRGIRSMVKRQFDNFDVEKFRRTISNN